MCIFQYLNVDLVIMLIIPYLDAVSIVKFSSVCKLANEAVVLSMPKRRLIYEWLDKMSFSRKIALANRDNQVGRQIIEMAVQSRFIYEKFAVLNALNANEKGQKTSLIRETFVTSRHRQQSHPPKIFMADQELRPRSGRFRFN